MNILHLEDSEDDAELIRESLRREFADCPVTRVDTRGAFIEAIDRSDWDVVLADYSLPSFDGVSALKLVVEKRPGLPFIFVTGSLGEELAIETLKNGATDYILKTRLHRLPQAVARAKRECESAKAKKQAEEDLKDSLREKSLLLQEVHHRVKNNLAIISSLLDMQSNAIDDPILAAALQESQRRIQSMSMIHELLYASTSLHDIDFADYTRALAAEISHSYGGDSERIQLVFELEPLRFEIDRAIPCGLILNELMSNAFKYAFPNGRSGEIHISLHLRDGRIRLAVEDTGVGLPEHAASEKSLGLNIVQILASQLEATLVITSNQGSQFVLTFPQSPAGAHFPPEA